MSEIEAGQWTQEVFTNELASWYTIAINGDAAEDQQWMLLDPDTYGDRWHMWRLVESNQYTLVPLGSDLPDGEGFWFRHKGPLPPRTARHTSEDCEPIGSPVLLDLSIGWSMAGNPFKQDIDTDALRVVGLGCEIGCTIEQAADANLVRARLWRWESSQYRDLLAERAIIEPGEAFWIRALQPVTLVIEHDAP